MEEDYLIRRNRRFHGVGPKVGTTHTLKWGDSRWPEWVIFNMEKYHSILVDINPLKKPSGVILLASRVASPRLLDAVWTYDELRFPVRIRTGDYWIAKSGCNTTGCPRIRFQVTRGSLAVTILKRDP